MGFSNDRTSGTTLARRRTSRSCARRRSPRLSSRYASFVSIVRTYVREAIVPVLCSGVWGAACLFVRESLCTRKRGIENISSPEDVRHCVHVTMRVCSFLCMTVHGIASCPFPFSIFVSFVSRQSTALSMRLSTIYFLSYSPRQRDRGAGNARAMPKCSERPCSALRSLSRDLYSRSPAMTRPSRRRAALMQFS